MRFPEQSRADRQLKSAENQYISRALRRGGKLPYAVYLKKFGNYLPQQFANASTALSPVFAA